MKRIKRTTIVIRHTEAFTGAAPLSGHHEIETCPLCHSVLQHDQSGQQIQHETRPHLLGDGELVDNGHGNK